jgi:hypothetical protein
VRKTAILTGIILLAIATTGYAQAKKPADAGGTIAVIVKKSLGKNVRIVRVEKAESSPLKGFKQIRVWLETPYGETPVLFYTSDDGRFFLAGSIFDAAGDNVTARTVGKTKPRVLSDKKMRLNDRYRIGPADAKVKVVLWMGMDRFCKIAFETFYKMFNNNRDVMSLYLKFYPKSERDAAALRIAACGKNEQAFEIFRALLDVAPGWGSPDDIEAFSREKGFTDASCGASTIREDIGLEKALRLPPAPVVFVNGTMLIEKLDRESVERISGTRLK